MMKTLTWFRHTRTAVLLLVFLVVPALASVLAAQDLGPDPAESRAFVTRDEVLARVEKSGADWKSAWSAQARPRLFFSADEWSALSQRATAPESAPLFDEALARAGQLEASPVWRSPEERTEKRPLSAQAYEELWQRSVGDDLVLMALGVVLRPDDQALREKLRQSVLTVCSYPQWGRSNASLASSHVGRGVAVAYSWAPDLWNEQEKASIREVVRARMGAMLEGVYGKAHWARRYTINHNQVSVAALGLCGLAFLSEIPEAAEWLAAAQINFEHVMSYNNQDGSSAEGVPYWSYGMSFILQYIEGVRRVVPEAGALYEADYMKNAVTFRQVGSTPGGGGLTQWGDAVNRDFYGPQHLLNRLASVYRDGGAQFLSDRISFGLRGGRDVVAWRALWFDPSVKAEPPSGLDHHLSVGDLVSTRSGWSRDDYLLAIKSGYNRRNHSHLDAGSLALAFGDEWLVTTSGYGKGGTQSAFWLGAGPRWTFQSNATESHTTLLINGANQRFHTEARATVRRFFSEDDWVFTDVDLTDVYNDVQSVRRRVLHRRGDYILVFDNVGGVRGAGDAEPLVEWLLQTSTKGAPSPEDARIVRIPGARGAVDVRLLAPEKAEFAPYQPRSERLDVPTDRLKSWTAAVSPAGEGGEAAFVVLLEPRFANAPSRVRASVTMREDGVSMVTVVGRSRDEASSGWTDTIMLAPDVRRLEPEGVRPVEAAGVFVRTTTEADGAKRHAATTLPTSS